MASLRRMTSNVAARRFSALAASLTDRIVLVGLMLRHWGPDLFADYSVIQSASTLLLIAELGIQIYFQNAEQAAFVTGNKPAFRRFAAIHLGIIATLVAALALLLTLATLSGATDRLLHLNQIDTRAARATLWFLAAGNLLTIVRSTTTSIYAATGNFAFTVVMTAVALIVTTLGSLLAVALGAGPTKRRHDLFHYQLGARLARIFSCSTSRRRFPDWVGGPATPTLAELREAGVHLKWFSLQVVGPTVWLQAPVLIFSAWGVAGRDITSFLLIRTMVNQIRQAFQFATIGAGIEIAPLAHRGDVLGAWRLSARVGLMTTVLCGALVAAVLIFGADVTRVWTGDESLFSLPIAIYLLAPLLAVVCLQQPLALLQYSNKSRVPGLQRLMQIVLGPLFCIIGQSLYGVTGLVVGLAISEVIANWALLPLLAEMTVFPGLMRYCLNSAGAAVAATAAGLVVGFALLRLAPATSIPALGLDMALWTLLTLTPMMLATLPEPVRQSLWRLLRPAAKAPQELRRQCSSGFQRRSGPWPIRPIFFCSRRRWERRCSGRGPRAPDAFSSPWLSSFC